MIIDNRDIDVDGHIDALCVDYNGVADDCDDNNANVFPGAPEFEDGQDNDCAGDIDEGSDAFDDDGDCYCEGNGPCLWSTNPACIALDIGDCDDSDAALNLDDLDGDGYDTCAGDCDDGDTALTPEDSDGDGFSTCDGDCDEGDANIYPSAPVVAGDGIDQD